MSNRLLLESEVIKAVDRYVDNDDKLLDDISCILDQVPSVSLVGSKEALGKLKEDGKPVEKEKRVQLYENDDIVLEQRGNKYYLSLYNKEGKFQREVTIAVKDDYKVSLFNDK